MNKRAAVAVVLVLLAAIVLLFRWTRRTPTPTAPDIASQPVTARAPGPELGGCDRQERPPQLPDALSIASDDMPAVVRALDAALTDQHKAWLRCFTLDDELLGRTQHGMGRWLRTTLRLRQRKPLLTAIGASTPDEASAIIVLVYAAHLRGQEISPTEAKKRRAEALAASGVTP